MTTKMPKKDFEQIRITLMSQNDPKKTSNWVRNSKFVKRFTSFLQFLKMF